MPGIQISSLQDLLTLRAIKEQADPFRSGIQALATGVQSGIETAREEAKAKKKSEEAFAQQVKLKDVDYTNSTKLEKYKAELKKTPIVTAEELQKRINAISGLGGSEDLNVKASVDLITGEPEASVSIPSRSEKDARIKSDLETRKLKIEEQKAIVLDKVARGELSPIEANKLIPSINNDDIQDALRERKFLGGVQSDGSFTSSGTNKVSKEGNIIKDGIEFEPTALDEFNNPTDYKAIKPSAAQEKRDVETKELTAQTKGLLELFVKARKEASSVPGFGKSGIEGRIVNLAAIAKAKAGLSPAVNVFQDRVAAFATISAKAAGEVRPTDKDIERFAKALTNLQNNDEENAIQISQVLKDISAKGQGVTWAKDIVDQFEEETGANVDFDFNFGQQDTSSNVKNLTIGRFQVEVE